MTDLQHAMYCRNCGHVILDDGRSPTGYIHSWSERSRCDGELFISGGKYDQYQLAQYQ